jgi:hypothetical protein
MTTLNPFARQARKSRKGTPSVDYDSDDFCDIKVVTLVPINTVDSKNSRHVYATMNIVGENMMPVRFQLDSGEACNIITTHALMSSNGVSVLSFTTINSALNLSSFFGLISLSWHVPSGFTVVLVYIFGTWMIFVL